MRGLYTISGIRYTDWEVVVYQKRTKMVSFSVKILLCFSATTIVAIVSKLDNDDVSINFVSTGETHVQVEKGIKLPCMVDKHPEDFVIWQKVEPRHCGPKLQKRLKIFSLHARANGILGI